MNPKKELLWSLWVVLGVSRVVQDLCVFFGFCLYRLLGNLGWHISFMYLDPRASRHASKIKILFQGSVMLNSVRFLILES